MAIPENCTKMERICKGGCRYWRYEKPSPSVVNVETVQKTASRNVNVLPS